LSRCGNNWLHEWFDNCQGLLKPVWQGAQGEILWCAFWGNLKGGTKQSKIVDWGFV
jgi:hypothetical protein